MMAAKTTSSSPWAMTRNFASIARWLTCQSHTDEVLRSVLNYPDAKLSELKSKRII